jgi:hypothetical protein
MSITKILRAVTLTGAIYGFAGWFYIAENAAFHPNTLSLPLTHLLPYPREDTFGAFCFAVSIICCFTYLLLPKPKQ